MARSVIIFASLFMVLLAVHPGLAQAASPYQLKPSDIADWCNSVKDIAPFTQPADGTVCGQAFKVSNAKFVSSANNFEFDDLIIASDGNAQKIEIKFDTGELAADITGWHHKADVEGFIAVFPDGLARDPERPQSFMRNPQFWNAGVASSGANRPDDVAFVRKLIDVIKQDHKIDDRRIYATGFSNGAAMSWRLAVELSDLIAAVGPVAGFLAIPEPKLIKAVPALVIACEDDPMIPIDGGMAVPRLCLSDSLASAQTN
ncbi:unnamed protein product [Sphagnum balticum]